MYSATIEFLVSKPFRPRQTQHYRKIVGHIEEMARARAEDSLRVEDLCNTVGVSQRTLRNAFRAVYGSPPYRYLRTLRMDRARHALLSADSSTVTVTQVAMRFGFLELGRFSVEYRLAFGECPSETLRRAIEANDIDRESSISKKTGDHHD